MIDDEYLTINIEKIPLYNNIASVGKCEGRLEVIYSIFPTPRIEWEFETLGRESCLPELMQDQTSLVNSFTGIDCKIDGCRPTSTTHIENFGNSIRRAMTGTANEVLFGDISADNKGFIFGLPNGRFLAKAFVDHSFIKTENYSKFSID